jgi:hypothetical protein
MENSTFSSSKKISPYLLTPYSHTKKFYLNTNPVDNNTFIPKDLCPLCNIIMINPLELINFLMQAGVLPNNPYVPKKNKKERMLKTIVKDVYHIGDNY